MITSQALKESLGGFSQAARLIMKNVWVSQ